MTLEFWVDLFVALGLTVLLAYIMATIDIALIHRRAKKRSEAQRIIDQLKRK